MMVEDHYDYYKFNGNVLTALLIAYLIRRMALGFFTARLGGIDLALVLIAGVLFMGSRNNLARYYRRVNMLLGERSTVDPSPIHEPVQDGGGQKNNSECLTDRPNPLR
jgi:hypothetical protein